MVSILCRLCAFLENRPAKKLILLRLELSGTGERKHILGFSLLLRDRRQDPIVWVWETKEKCSPVSWKTAYPFHFRRHKMQFRRRAVERIVQIEIVIGTSQRIFFSWTYYSKNVFYLLIYLKIILIHILYYILDRESHIQSLGFFIWIYIGLTASKWAE